MVLKDNVLLRIASKSAKTTSSASMERAIITKDFPDNNDSDSRLLEEAKVHDSDKSCSL